MDRCGRLPEPSRHWRDSYAPVFFFDDHSIRNDIRLKSAVRQPGELTDCDHPAMTLPSRWQKGGAYKRVPFRLALRQSLVGFLTGSTSGRVLTKVDLWRTKVVRRFPDVSLGQLVVPGQSTLPVCLAADDSLNGGVTVCLVASSAQDPSPGPLKARGPRHWSYRS